MRLFLLASVFFLLADSKAQRPDLSTAYLAKYRLKLSVFDQAVFSLPTVKISNEFLLRVSRISSYASVDLGYNFYSVDEDARSSGYYVGAKYSLYSAFSRNVGRGVQFGIFYLKSSINDYLKVTHTHPGMGQYFEYEKMKYHKERYGFSVEHFDQYTISNNFIAEFCVGFGLMYMRTITPSRVTQNTFINGLTTAKETVTPTLILNFKIGYLVF
jgi:hypothetical protein